MGTAGAHKKLIFYQGQGTFLRNRCITREIHGSRSKATEKYFNKQSFSFQWEYSYYRSTTYQMHRQPIRYHTTSKKSSFLKKKCILEKHVRQKQWKRTDWKPHQSDLANEYKDSFHKKFFLFQYVSEKTHSELSNWSIHNMNFLKTNIK